MKKFISRVLSFTLILSMSFTSGISTFASEASTANQNIYQKSAGSSCLTETGVYINSVYYTKEQFMQLLDTAIEKETSSSGGVTTYSAIALAAGTWWIPGVGEVVITAAGAVIIAGVVYEAGSWIYDAVVNWFAERQFNKSAEKAVENCNRNKQIHIMKSKHNWNKFKKNPKWTDVSPILIKVLKEGSEKWEKNNQYIRTLVYKGETVVVRFIKDADGLVKYISTAWCK
jgi:hypothetical protein